MPAAGLAVLVFAAAVTVQPKLPPLVEISFEIESKTLRGGIAAQRTPQTPHLTPEWVERTIAQDLATAALMRYGYLRWLAVDKKDKPAAGTAIRMYVKLRETEPARGEKSSDYYLEYLKHGTRGPLLVGDRTPIFYKENAKPIYNAANLSTDVKKRFDADMRFGAGFASAYVSPVVLCECAPEVDGEIAKFVLPFPWESLHVHFDTRVFVVFSARNPAIRDRLVSGTLLVGELKESREHNEGEAVTVAGLLEFEYGGKVVKKGDPWDPEIEAVLRKPRLDTATTTMQTYVPRTGWGTTTP
ncbi:MAG TPA: hypothetical protein VF057_09095 [Thermoanaerobaculia bacterium]